MMPAGTDSTSAIRSAAPASSKVAGMRSITRWKAGSPWRTDWPKSPRSAPVRKRPYCTRNGSRSEEHTSELQSPYDLVCRLLLEKKKDDRRLLYQGHKAEVHEGLPVVVPFMSTLQALLEDEIVLQLDADTGRKLLVRVHLYMQEL